MDHEQRFRVEKDAPDGCKALQLAGIVSVIGALAGTYAYLFIIVPVIAVSLYTVVYSYTEFKKEQAAGTGR